VAIDVTLSNCLWRDGYSATNGSPILTATINEYINVDANKDRIIRVMDLIAIAKNTHDSTDPTMQPILIDFNLEQPTANRVLVSQEMSVPGVITIS
jgi:hypothetical protein